MKRKVKYKNFDRILTVALLGDYSQNVPKPKRTQVKMYLRGDKIYSSEIKTYPSGVKTYPVYSQNVPMIFVLASSGCEASRSDASRSESSLVEMCQICTYLMPLTEWWTGSQQI